MNALRPIVAGHWRILLLALVTATVVLGAELAPATVQGFHQNWLDSCNNDFGYADCSGYEASAAASCAASGGSFSSSYIPQMCEGTTCVSGFFLYSCDVPHAAPTCATEPTMDGCSCSKSTACDSTSGTYSGGVCTAPEPAACPVCAPPDPCTSYPNVCGEVGSGSIQCDGSCNALIPGVSDQCPGDPGIQCSVYDCSAAPEPTCADYGQLGTYPFCYDPPPPPPTGDPVPTVNLSASDSDLVLGESSTLTWSSTDTDSCTSPDFATGNQRNGSVAVTPGTTGAHIYDISCTGPGGTTPDSVTINVGSAGGGSCTDAGPVTLTASPNRVQAGSAVPITIEWTVAETADTTCILTNANTGDEVGTSAVNAFPACDSQGAATVSGLGAQTVFRLSCGALAEEVIVNVVPQFQEF